MGFVDVEKNREDFPESSNSNVTQGDSEVEVSLRSRRKWIALGILEFVVAITIVCIALPLVLRDEKRKEDGITGDNIYNNNYNYDGTCLNNENGMYPEIDAITLDFYRDLFIGFDADDESIAFGPTRSFDVEPYHTVVDGGEGVIFNVETVSDPLLENLHKPTLTHEEIIEAIQEEVAEFYNKDAEANFMESDNQDVFPENVYPEDVLLEVTSSLSPSSQDGSDTGKEDNDLVYAGGQGFFAACLMSFAQHLPLRLSPDDLWAVIVNSFARHVNKYAEDLRHNFVNHEGKKEIVIYFCGATPGGQSSSPDVWEESVFPVFSEAIANNMNNPEAHATLTSPFSTTTPSRQAAVEIALMATMKHYFEYSMGGCGIPRIQLDGNREDWVLLRDKTERLGSWMMPNSMDGDLWIYDIVLPILDEFVHAYDGNVDYCFWQSMIKFRSQQVPGMCSPPDSDIFETILFLTGWLQSLYLYLEGREGQEPQPNPYLKKWTEVATANQIGGPDPEDIPTLLSSAPVGWKSCVSDEAKNVTFHAGFRGVRQDKADGTLSPVLGWYISYDPE